MTTPGGFESSTRVLRYDSSLITNDDVDLEMGESAINIVVKSDSTTCSICLESFKLGENIMYTKCLHIFHQRCGSRWIDHELTLRCRKPTCPICLSSLEVKVRVIPSRFNEIITNLGNILRYICCCNRD